MSQKWRRGRVLKAGETGTEQTLEQVINAPEYENEDDDDDNNN